MPFISCRYSVAGEPTIFNRAPTVGPHLSDKRKGQMSGTGGVAGLSLASAMMCSKVMSVCVQTSATHTSCGAPLWLCRATADVPLVGVRCRTWTTMGSRLMASTTASSWSTLEKSRAFTCWDKTANHSVNLYLFMVHDKSKLYYIFRQVEAAESDEKIQ